MSRVALFLAVLVVGCNSAEPGTDASPPIREDAAPPPQCDVSPPLELGRCVDEAGGGCDGGEELALFAPLEDGASIAPVIGPQSSTMFALAIRASGVAPGDPDVAFSSSNPELDLLLAEEGGHEVARYRGRSGLRAVDGVEDTFENPQVFVVVDERPSSLRGQTFTVSAVLRDVMGEVGCGTLRFVAE